MSGAAPARTKVAVLSFAHGHATGYVRYLLSRRDVEVIACDPGALACPEDGPRGLELANQLGVTYVESTQEALAWGPDAVVVCCENINHRAMVEQAAAAGAQILCEKPLATTAADAAAMLAAVQRAGVALMVAYPVRFSDSFVDLLAQVRAGALGEVLAVMGTNNGQIPLADRQWFTDPALSGGGCFVDHIVHCADLLDALLGQSAASVRAVSNAILHAEAGVPVETGGMVTITYPSGVIATIDCSWSQPLSAPNWGGLTLEVVGTKGSIKISPFASHVDGFGPRDPIWLPFGPDLDAAMIDEFLRGVAAGRNPQPDGHVGLRTVSLMNAAQQSARTGQPVTL